MMLRQQVFKESAFDEPGIKLAFGLYHQDHGNNFDFP